MKKLYLLMLFFAAMCTSVSISQEARELPILLEVLDQNHMGSVSDVFSEAEIDILGNHFERNFIAESSAASLGAPIYATEDQTSMFGHFMLISPGTFNPLSTSPVPDFEGAGVYDPFDEVFFAIDSANNVWAMDDFTGAYANLGMITPPAGETFTGLEFDPADGTLYGLSTDGMGNTTLSTINTTTLAVTPVGFTGLTLGISLAIDNNGFAYSYDIDDDNLYQLDKTSGAGTLIGNIGFDANFGQGMFRDSTTGNLYMTAFNNDSFDSELREVNTTTGSTMMLGTIIDGMLAQMGWGSMFQALSGIADQSFYDFSMSPVPASNYINLKSNNVIENIAVYNMLGQLIADQAVNEDTLQLNVEVLETGSYLLKVQIDGSVATYRFIKQ